MKKNTLNLHFELLPENTRKIFEDLVKFEPQSILGGGTAIMLLFGHRRSFDLDIFVNKPIPKRLLLKLKTVYQNKLSRPLVDTQDELSVIISPDTKVSFIFFPFKPLHATIKTVSIDIFSLKDLASNKAYVIGRRGAWRDYVDLFFLLKNGVEFKQVITEAKKRFGGAFSEKLFLEQLTYYGDLADFTADFIGASYKPKDIQSFFQKLVRDFLKEIN